MSGLEEAYLGLVIGAVTLFMAVLAWACIYTRGAKTSENASQKHATSVDRLAA
jgi:hypothetical protein